MWLSKLIKGSHRTTAGLKVTVDKLKNAAQLILVGWPAGLQLRQHPHL